MEKISHVVVNPLKSLNLLSQTDIEGLTTSRGDLFALFRHCALAILNTDSAKVGSESSINDYADFDIHLIQQPRGLRLELFNAPPQSFVDGKMIRGTQAEDIHVSEGAQRTLRLADGPDAVHRMVVGRNELRKYTDQKEVNATFRDG